MSEMDKVGAGHCSSAVALADCSTIKAAASSLRGCSLHETAHMVQDLQADLAPLPVPQQR